MDVKINNDILQNEYQIYKHTSPFLNAQIAGRKVPTARGQWDYVIPYWGMLCG